MKIRGLALCAIALLLPLVAGACGDDATDEGDRPSAAAISDAIKAADTTGALTDELAECIGEVMFDSDIPDRPLRLAVDGKEADISEQDLDTYTEIAGQAGATCAGSVETPTTTTAG